MASRIKTALVSSDQRRHRKIMHEPDAGMAVERTFRIGKGALRLNAFAEPSPPIRRQAAHAVNVERIGNAKCNTFQCLERRFMEQFIPAENKSWPALKRFCRAHVPLAPLSCGFGLFLEP